MLGGCTTSNRQLEDAHQALAMRDMEIVRLRHRLEEREAAREAALALESQVAKLDERLATHEEQLSRLATTRAQVATVDADQAEAAVSAPELDAEIAIHEFELGLQESLATIHSLEASAAARTAAYKRLLRQVELLVNTGRVRAISMSEGRIRFALPARIDIVDPWPGGAH